MPTLPLLRDPQPRVARRIEQGLVAQREKRDADRHGNRLALSQIGKCARDLWAAVNWVPEDEELPPHVLGIFEHGNVIEAHVVNLLRIGGYAVRNLDPATGEQYRVSDFDNRVSGRTDGQIATDRWEWMLLEIKSANARQFAVAQGHGIAAWKPEYVAQVQAYMGYTELDACLFVVFNKNDFRLNELGRWVSDSIYSERIRFDQDRFDELREKAGAIVDSLVLLDRPAAATSQFCKFCKYCNRNKWCWDAATGVVFDD